MFKIGTIVTATTEARYNITSTQSLCVVVDYGGGYGTERMKVRIIGHVLRSYVGEEYYVDDAYFVETTVEEWCRSKNVDVENIDEEYRIVTEVGTIPETVMDRSATTTLTVEERAELHKQMNWLLNEYYQYGASWYGIEVAINNWFEKKQWIIAAMKKHPNYVPGRFYIQFSKNYVRNIEMEEIDKFRNWASEQIKSMFKEKEITILADKFECWNNRCRKINRIIDLLNGLSDVAKCDINAIKIYGKTYDEYVEEKEWICYILRNFKDKGVHCFGGYFKEEDYEAYRKSDNFLSALTEVYDKIIDESLAKKLNEYFPILSFRAGQRVTTVVNKWAKHIGLDKVKDMQTVMRNGEYVQKDCGWNYHYAQFCDAVSPMEYTRHTIISANIVDYLTMSHGNSWASCHTPDKWGVRAEKNDGHSYRGCYSSGDISYSGDPSTLVYYTVSPDVSEDAFMPLEDKERRCLFMIGEDKMVQSRVYPDGRDNPNAGIVKQFRNVMQKVVADIFDTPNYWTIEKGTNACHKVSNSYGTHYRDYLEYEDCNVSYLKRGETERKNFKKITIGSDPTCLRCGMKHDDNEWLLCYDCRDSNIVDQDTGIGYESERAAIENDVVYCENVNGWHSRNLEEDGYTGEHIYVDGLGYDYICTEDYTYFVNGINARNAGYRQDAFGTWVRETA